MMRFVTAARDVMARRFTAQLLSRERAATVLDVAGRLLAIQGQDPRGARLAVRARSSGLTAADVDKALTADRSLLITWLNRGTLHLIRSEDYWLLHRLMLRPQHELQCQRMIARSGVTPDEAEKAVAVITQALAADGPLTRPQLRDRLVATGIPGDGGAVLHLLMMTCQRGLAVRGPMIGAQHAYVLVRDWFGQAPPRGDFDADLAELARRYLAGHGPASDRDLAKWAGLPLGEVRRGLTAIAPQLRERADGLAELHGAAELDGAADADELPGPRLLGAYDPVLLGWASREPILGPHQQIVTVNGLFRPFALVDGRAAGMWSWSAGRLATEPFSVWPAEVETALAAEARDVQRFLGTQPELADE
jgi:winged helix DNA-binding protein